MRHGYLLRTTAFALAAIIPLAFAQAAPAATPTPDTRNPGYYHVQVGAFQVTALSDGTVELPMDKLLHAPEDEVRAALKAHFLSAPTETSVNGYLINTGDELVLVDTGAGSLFGPTLGNLVDSLETAGYRPAQVDEVYLTHMHPDHLGGLTRDGERVFPNAVVRADRDDSAYWLDPANMEKAPEGQKGMFKGAMASLKPYREAGAFEPFDDGTELAPGIHAQPAPGHTPGHTTYRLESDGEAMVLWGDLMHAAAVQFDHPEVAIDFDSDPEQAIASREAAYEKAAETGVLVAGAHLPFPGIGHIRADGQGYEWFPVNYSPD
ncbi:MBL fold metallo-hydrolase [Arhodomonas aquaeolei]|uniref:MBL fold metallo-hydrolase n=1 Tax=Arhodomonas aquaeolei TaxID=2369 RepID=UPI00216A7051|nr:MBL fold metallo-hydrolase [Arhodomonas aquaeolei]MCS4504936.1 MBL fold metallo-hydrolase [Arhodomonas aquaeolei]